MPPQHATVAPSVRSARLPTPCDGEAARICGGILLLIGVGGMLFAYNMDISVSAPASVYAAGGEIINTGLVADRLVAMIAAATVAVLGMMSLVMAAVQGMHHSTVSAENAARGKADDAAWLAANRSSTG